MDKRVDPADLCWTCGCLWSEHQPTCSRHAYRPMPPAPAQQFTAARERARKDVVNVFEGRRRGDRLP